MVEEKINTWQATALLTTSIMSTTLLFTHSMVARAAGRDAWLAFLLGGLYGLLLVGLMVALNAPYPGLNYLQVGEVLLGRYLSKVFILAYAFFLVIITSILVREFSVFMVTAFMPHTPVELFGLVIVGISLYAVYQGIEVLVRASEVVFLVTVFSLLIFSAMGIGELDLSVLLPLLESGMGPVWRGSLIFLNWTGEVFLLGMLFPYLNRPAQAWKAGAATIAVLFFFIINGYLFLESFLGYQLTSRIFFPMLGYVRMVGITGFWERIEALVILVWVAGIYVKISFFIFSAAAAIKQLFGIKDKRPFLLPLGALIVFLSIMFFENTMELVEFIRSSRVLLTAYFAVILPLFIYLLHIIRSALGFGTGPS